MHTPLKKLSLPKKTLLVSVFSMAACQVSAAGFQLNAQSATGLGRAFAGDAVIADNASVMSRNAAAMALFDKTALSFGLNVLETDISVSDATYTTSPTFGGVSSESNYSDAGGTSYAPNFYLIVPINDKVAFGIDLYSNFGTKTDFSSSFDGDEYGGLTDIKSMNLGLAVSYRVNQQWSVGGGLDIIYGTGELERDTSDNLYSFSGTTLLDADVAGTGVGFNLGVVFELDENNRFGLSYHYSPELEAEGDVSKYDSTTSTTVTATNDTLYLNLPDMAEFSGYHRIKDTKYAVHYSVQWIGWSSFDTLESETYGTISEYQWKDAFHFSLGALTI
jgi:long-chain fatty acid transport protein